MVSCATQSNSSQFSPVYLTNRAQFYLLPASEIEFPVDKAQQISIIFDGQELTMGAWVKADENGIDIAMFNVMGIGMGDFSFSDSGVSLNSPVFPPNFMAEYLAADFQLCYFKPESLKKALNIIKLNFDIELTQNEQGLPVEIRRISDSGRKIIEITKTGNEIRYNNILRNYGFILMEAE